MKTSIKDVWAEFSDNVIPAEAPQVQVWECRRSFYAGAHAMLAMALEISNGNEEDAAADILEKICAEIKEFYVDVERGLA